MATHPYDRLSQGLCAAQGTWPCGVCFEEALGRDCVRLAGCGHVFCAECVGEHCRLHVREGSVARLTCLAFKCGAELPHQVRAVP